MFLVSICIGNLFILIIIISRLCRMCVSSSVAMQYVATIFDWWLVWLFWWFMVCCVREEYCLLSRKKESNAQPNYLRRYSLEDYNVELGIHILWPLCVTVGLWLGLSLGGIYCHFIWIFAPHLWWNDVCPRNIRKRSYMANIYWQTGTWYDTIWRGAGEGAG